MRESGYYPAGAEHDPNAPWNEKPIQDVEFDVNVVQSVERTCSVITNTYMPVYDEDTREEYNDTSNVDWNREWMNQYMSIPDLLSEFAKYAEQELKVLDQLSEDAWRTREQKRYWKKIIENCKGWRVVDTEVEEL